MTSAVLPGDSLPTGAVHAFYISHLYRRTDLPGAQPEPSTLDELRAQEAEQERQRRDHEQATAKARAKFLAKQKRLPLTLSEVEGRELPTLAGAHQTLVELGCEITASDGTLQISVPQRLRENDNEDLDARKQCTNRPACSTTPATLSSPTCRRTRSYRTGRSQSAAVPSDERHNRMNKLFFESQSRGTPFSALFLPI